MEYHGSPTVWLNLRCFPFNFQFFSNLKGAVLKFETMEDKLNQGVSILSPYIIYFPSLNETIWGEGKREIEEWK